MSGSRLFRSLYLQTTSDEDQQRHAREQDQERHMNLILDPKPTDAIALASAIAITLGDVATNGPMPTTDGGAATLIKWPSMTQATDFQRFLVQLQALVKK